MKMKTTNSIIPTSSTAAFDYAKAGDICNVITIINTVLFGVLAGTYKRNPSFTFFDEVWKQEGFCVTNRDVPYWNSHDMCLYVDTILALVAAGLFWKWRKDPGMETANVIFQANIPGVMLHGVAHGVFGKAIREGTVHLEDGNRMPIDIVMETNPTPWEMAVAILPLVAFWFFLSKASMPQLSNVYIAIAAALATWRQMWTPNDFGFTYVQTVLLLEFSINQLFRPNKEKDFAYFWYPALVGLPLTLVGWMESTMCSTFVRDLFYGHLLYDAYIPLAMMTWYAMVHSHAASTSSSSKRKQL